MVSLYERDFHAWTLDQAESLRQQKWEQLDLPNLIEEVESLGRQERRELRHRLGILIGHLLKWQYQPDRRSKSWRATIRVQRQAVRQLLDENPSLQTYLTEAMPAAYEIGLAIVVQETPLDYLDLPPQLPYSTAEILDAAFPADLSQW
jgi:hypothetical protein